MPDDFDKILSVMRSRGVSVSIILQNLAQLKALFEKQWESIVGNCDELLYLGGNDQSAHEYVSKLLGKETLDTNTFGKSTGRNGNYSTNYQQTGRELMTPDEVRMLDNRYALLFIRGERPVMDEKYDILRHPNVGGSVDGHGDEYNHGDFNTDIAVASMSVIGKSTATDDTPQSPQQFESNSSYGLFDQDDLEIYYNKLEEQTDEKAS